MKITYSEGEVEDAENDMDIDDTKVENTAIVPFVAPAPAPVPPVPDTGNRVFGNAADPIEPPKKLMVTAQGDIVAQPPTYFDPSRYKSSALEKMRYMFDKQETVADIKYSSWILLVFNKPDLCEDLFHYLIGGNLCDIVGVAQHPGTTPNVISKVLT
jgi:hypothetical protein